MEANRGEPTPPIALSGDPAAATGRFSAEPAKLPASLADDLAATGAEVVGDLGAAVEWSRDWWPLAMIWATDNQVPQRPGLVVRARDAAQVAAVLRLCNEARVPVTTSAGRSGVCGSAVPVFGGVVLDVTGLTGIVAVDRTSCRLVVRPGMFGDVLEDELRAGHGMTLGHWPQSIALSTVGGWLACRSAGQYSNRYGKIEDMVVAMEVALAGGRIVRTGGQPRAAVGPDLNQLFVGSEGTLGVITEATLRVHPLPEGEFRAAFAFASFADGLDACRRIVQRGATPAVLRLYDEIESKRNFDVEECALIVLDEGDPALIDGGHAVVEQECASATRLEDSLVERWLGHRNDVSALERLISGGLVVDTIEIAGPWTALPRIYDRATAAIRGCEGTLVASAHQSHAYLDGACIYFTFAGKVDGDRRDAFYREAWDAATRAVLAEGGALSHHHGVGINRARFVPEALGAAFEVLVALKRALDPNGILNPGKLGLPSPWGDAPPWP